MAFAALAGIISGIGAFMQGTQQAQQMSQQAAIEEYKAKVMKQNAETAAKQASAEVERSRRESRQVLGAQRAAIAESGTAFMGSNLDIIRQSTTMAELDALNIQYAGEVERQGLLQEATMAEYNAKNLRSSAKSAMKLRWLSALGSGMNAYGGAGGKTYLGSKPGKG